MGYSNVVMFLMQRFLASAFGCHGIDEITLHSLVSDIGIGAGFCSEPAPTSVTNIAKDADLCAGISERYSEMCIATLSLSSAVVKSLPSVIVIRQPVPTASIQTT